MSCTSRKGCLMHVLKAPMTHLSAGLHGHQCNERILKTRGSRDSWHFGHDHPRGRSSTCQLSRSLFDCSKLVVSLLLIRFKAKNESRYWYRLLTSFLQNQPHI